MSEPLNETIYLIEVTSQTKKEAPLYDTVANQLKRRLGRTERIFWSLDCGCVKARRDGKYYDWQIDSEGKLQIIESK